MKWRLKIFFKILLSKLPINYSLWKSLGLFKHGRMDCLDYPIKIFNLHIKKAYPKIIPKNLIILELGPGDSIASAIIGYAYGVSKTYLIDVDNYAIKDRHSKIKCKYHNREGVWCKYKGRKRDVKNHEKICKAYKKA